MGDEDTAIVERDHRRPGPRELCGGMGVSGGLSEGGSSRPGSDTQERGRMGVLGAP